MKLHDQIKEALENLDNLEVICIDAIDEAKLKTGGTYTKQNGKFSQSNAMFNIANTMQDLTPFLKFTTVGPGAKGTMGGYVKSSMSLGTGYGVQVTDFGEVCTINVTYSNAQTGRTAGQNFAIIFRGPHSPWTYTAYVNSAKWRNCTGIDQAVSFIKSRATALANLCSSPL